MTISDWVNIAAAILVGGGTLFLGIMAWRTIRQTRSIQKAEKRERLLNEIIEWASGCMSCAFEIDRPHLREAKSVEQYIDRMQTDLTDKLKSFQTKEKYIKGIATPSLFGQSLSDAIKISIDCLDLTIKCIEKDTPNTDEEERKQVKEQLNEFIDREGGGLYKCMNKVLEEVANIKTRDIG
jgi:hypothetical protein